MERAALLTFVVMYGFLCGCGPQTTTRTPRANNNVMDISTWDFDEDSNMRSNPMLGTQDKNTAVYAIAVGTFSNDGHAQAAQVALSSLIMQYPSLGRSLVIRPRSRGSVLTYGQYSGYDDPRAKNDLVMLRTFATPQGRPLFTQLLFTKFKTQRSKQTLHKYDLWTVRRDYPTIVPIYTLEVAVWGDFNSGQFPKERRRAAAEKYAAELRGRGFEAYFYHNDDRELSSVTVGLFGRDAIDAGSGFYSPEVDAMLSRFPERLMNGQTVLVYRNPQDQSQGTRVQPPSLAEVPID